MEHIIYIIRKVVEVMEYRKQLVYKELLAVQCLYSDWIISMALIKIILQGWERARGCNVNWNLEWKLRWVIHASKPRERARPRFQKFKSKSFEFRVSRVTKNGKIGGWSGFTRSIKTMEWTRVKCTLLIWATNLMSEGSSNWSWGGEKALEFKLLPRYERPIRFKIK